MQKHRKLAAIMFTDIVGYTAMMAKDEDSALSILQRHRDITKLLVSQFNGELLKEMGDGTLCSFSSVVDSVNCALEIQHLMKNETEFKLRIGIHIGDVVVGESDVFGDGVNVASRIEKLAEPGGICISERVYYDIKNKPVLEATFLGEKRLKNVESPVKVYSLTRGGMRAPVSKPPEEEQIIPKQVKARYRWLLFAGVVVIVIIAGYSLYNRFALREEPVPEAPVPITEETSEGLKSIAVLPFVNMSADSAQVYFCDGIADAILNALTHVGDLRVIARSSSFAFRGNAVDIRKVGEELDVEWVLEGGVQKAGNELRITAQLINVKDLSHLFSNVYERNLEDVFAIQEEISLAIVDTLKVKLLGEEKKAIEKRYTENIEAYNLYLLGKNSRGITREQRLDYYHQAIDKDPDFALAYVGLARVLADMGDLKASREAIERAIDIDETLAEAYCEWGWFNFNKIWDFHTAETSYKHSLKLNPGLSETHMQYAVFLRAMGRYNEAILAIKRARELDPLPVYTYAEAMYIYVGMDRYDDAMEHYRKVIEIDPEYYWAHWTLARLYYKQGNYKDAIDTVKKITEFPGSQSLNFPLAYIYAVSGERDKAEKMLTELIEHESELIEHTYWGYNSWIAMVYTGLGEYDKAFEWLEKAYRDRELLLLFIKDNFEWDPIRHDPRFKALLKKMGLPED